MSEANADAKLNVILTYSNPYSGLAANLCVGALTVELWTHVNGVTRFNKISKPLRIYLVGSVVYGDSAGYEKNVSDATESLVKLLVADWVRDNAN